jgi:hypothetical protein
MEENRRGGEAKEVEIVEPLQDGGNNLRTDETERYGS